MMTPPVLAVLGAFAVAFVVIAILKVVSPGLGWVDRPGDPLKIHTQPIPLSGGVGVALGTIVGLALTDHAWNSPGPLGAIIIPAMVVALVGLWDDIRGLRPATRLVVEVVAAVMVGFAGIASGLFALAPSAPAPLWALLVLGFATVGGINALNMQDGMDGLAGSLALISSIGLALAANRAGSPLLMALGLAQAGAIGAFLCFNFPPATVFLGDSGSYFLGFLTSAAAVALAIGYGTLTAYVGAGLVVGLPGIDAAYAIVRRLMRRQSPFRGDRDHLYDQLLGRGVAPRPTLAIASALQVTLVTAGVLLLGGL